MATANTIDMAGRKPQVVSAMSNGIVWVGCALCVLLLGVVIVGFRTRILKKQHQAEVTVTQTAAHDAAQSNRTQVRGRADATPLSAVTGGPTPPNTAATTSNLGPVDAFGHAIGGAVSTVAHPFPGGANPPAGPAPTNPNPPAAPVYYYAPPVPNYGQSAETEDPSKKERLRAEERRLAAIQAPTSIVSNGATQSGPSSRAIDPIQADLDRIAQLSNAANGITRPVIGGGGYPPFGAASSGMAVSEDDLNQQNGKRKFQQEEEGDYLKTTRVAPLSRWVVERGDKIVAILPTKVVTDLPGDLVAQVKDDVYDSPTHKFIMIPAGSLLAGDFNSSVSYGQGRVQVVWTYLRFPDGSYINLDKFVSHAADGAVGLKDQTDNHIKRLVGGVLLSSIFAAGIQISQNHSGTNSTLTYPSTTQIASSAVGQQAGQLGEQITSRNLNVQPTLKIRPGEPFYVSVQKSMLFSGPYQAINLGGQK
jgi:type IV secretory pathway VirB10-like protein